MTKAAKPKSTPKPKKAKPDLSIIVRATIYRIHELEPSMTAERAFVLFAEELEKSK